MDRRSPRRRWALIGTTAGLSALAMCASPHGGWLAPVAVHAAADHKPGPSPLPTLPPVVRPTPTPAPTPRSQPTPTPAAPPSSHPRDDGGHQAATGQGAAHAAASTQPSTPPPATEPPFSSSVASTPAPVHLAQRTTVPTSLTSFAQTERGQLSPLVLSADILAAVAVAGSLLLAELRRRRLV